MKKYISLLLILLVFNIVYNPPLSARFKKVLTPGTMVEYKLIDEDNKISYLKMSVLEKTTKGYWVEYRFKYQDEKSIIKMLTDIKKGEVKRLILQSGNESPKEMPAMIVEQMKNRMGVGILEGYGREVESIKSGRYKDEESDVIVKKKSRVKVKTKAGTFRCEYIKVINKKENDTFEYYLSKKVPYPGLVKIVENGKTRLILIRYKKKGAKSEIKGKVEKLNIPNIPGMPNLFNE